MSMAVRERYHNNGLTLMISFQDGCPATGEPSSLGDFFLGTFSFGAFSLGAFSLGAFSLDALTLFSVAALAGLVGLAADLDLDLGIESSAAST